MKTIEAYPVLANTVFCDDVRYEIGNKSTLVGVYRGRMLVHGDFPALIPKFACAVSYLQRKDQIILPAKVLIFLPGDSDDKPSFASEIPYEEAALRIADEELKFDEGIKKEDIVGPGYLSMEAAYVLSPLVINQPGIIKVRITRNDELFRAGMLIVQKSPPTTSTPKE
jgi:hypothetical protein